MTHREIDKERRYENLQLNLGSKKSLEGNIHSREIYEEIEDSEKIQVDDMSYFQPRAKNAMGCSKKLN